MSAIRYSADAKAQALQQVHALQGEGYSRRAAVHRVSDTLGCRAETLNGWLRRETHQQRSVSGASTVARLQFLERELLRLQRLNARLQLQLLKRSEGPLAAVGAKRPAKSNEGRSS